MSPLTSDPDFGLVGGLDSHARGADRLARVGRHHPPLTSASQGVSIVSAISVDVEPMTISECKPGLQLSAELKCHLIPVAVSTFTVRNAKCFTIFCAHIY